MVDTLRTFERSFGAFHAVGVATFGPVGLDSGSETYGRLLRTPKAGWSGTDLLQLLKDAFGVPVALASDVEGAALAEGAEGAARGAEPFVYVTVGTGVGAGLVAGGHPRRGVLHPEVGHLAVPRIPGDGFAGVCPFHGDCLEGMASGPAIAARWGTPAEELTGDARQEALCLEAAYLAGGFRALAYSYAPQRIVVGGGVGLMPGLLPLVRQALTAELAGYPGPGHFDHPDFVVPAALGAMAGPAGALLLAASATPRYP